MKKYEYDYPEQREIAKDLTTPDKLFIMKQTGLSQYYIAKWCAGTRKSEAIYNMAITLQKLNLQKFKEVEQIN